jgi:hypothetical protein
MCVKSLPNPAWLFLGNVVSHMGHLLALALCVQGRVYVDTKPRKRIRAVACKCVYRTHKMMMCLSNSQDDDSMPRCVCRTHKMMIACSDVSVKLTR